MNSRGPAGTLNRFMIRTGFNILAIKIPSRPYDWSRPRSDLLAVQTLLMHYGAKYVKLSKQFIIRKLISNLPEEHPNPLLCQPGILNQGVAGS